MEFSGPHFGVFFNGRQFLKAEDKAFSNPGTVGLCTKDDSVTGFDDFDFGPEALPAAPPVRK